MAIWINPRLVEQSSEDFYGPAEPPLTRPELIPMETSTPEEKLPFLKYVT